MAHWEASTLVQATPEKVFEYLTNLDLQHQIDRRRGFGLHRLEPAAPGPLDLGSRFRAFQRSIFRRPGWRDSVVTVFERPRRFGFESTSKIGPARVRLENLYELWPEGGVTRLVHRVQGPHGLGLAGRGLARMIEKRGWDRAQRHTVQALDDLREAAERFVREADWPRRRRRARLPVRQLAAIGLLGAAAAGYAAYTLRGPAPHFRFVTEWFVPAAPEAVWQLLSDAQTYPEWWPTVYLDVRTEGGGPLPRVGARAHFFTRGKLPYKLNWDVVITEVDAPRTITLRATGDFVGEARWTIEPAIGGAHARLDWELIAEKPILRLLNPIARPLLEWNHRWAMAQGEAGIRSRLAVPH